MAVDVSLPDEICFFRVCALVNLIWADVGEKNKKECLEVVSFPPLFCLWA